MESIRKFDIIYTGNEINVDSHWYPCTLVLWLLFIVNECYSRIMSVFPLTKLFSVGLEVRYSSLFCVNWDSWLARLTPDSGASWVSICWIKLPRPRLCICSPNASVCFLKWRLRESLRVVLNEQRVQANTSVECVRWWDIRWSLRMKHCLHVSHS